MANNTTTMNAKPMQDFELSKPPHSLPSQESYRVKVVFEYFSEIWQCILNKMEVY